MKKIKIISAILALCMMVTMLSGCRFIKGGAIATVNGEDISSEEFALYFIQVQNELLANSGVTSLDQAKQFWNTVGANGKTPADEARQIAIDAITLIWIKCQRAEEFGVELTEEEKGQINEQIGQQITQMGGNSVFQSELKAIGSTQEAYASLMEKMLLASKVDEKLMADPQYSVTEDDAIKNIKDTYIKAKHILVNTMDVATGAPYTEEQLKEADAKVKDIQAKLKDGADFDALMNEFSEDPGLETSPDGYVFGKGQMVPEFEEAAYALKEGEISEPVKSSYGYHIIKREAHNVTDAEAAEYVSTEMQLLQYSKFEKLYGGWKEEAKIKINEKKLAKVDVMQ